MKLKGNPVSPGIAVGKFHIYKPAGFEVTECFCESGTELEQIARYEKVRIAAAAELETLRQSLEKDDPEEAKIFEAHKDIVDDPAIIEEITESINGEHWTGEWAIWKIYTKFIAMVKRARDTTIAERAIDFEDVSKRLLRIWSGGGPDGDASNLAGLHEPVIVVAEDLLPSDTASLDRNNVLAILTEKGGPASHSAIIARSYGIPAVLGIPGLLAAIETAHFVAVDAFSGEIFPDPDGAFVLEYTKKREAFLKEREETRVFLNVEGRTADGVRIEVGLNIGNADDTELQGAVHTDFAGLFRTEFLFMGRDTLPDEEEQFNVYRRVLETYGKKPVALRTLDIGGDKPLRSIELPKEDNPFLGNRALRLCFSHPDIFRTQLRAALRASVYGNLWLMFPMVGSIEDIHKAGVFVDEVKSDLKKAEIPFDSGIKTGIMIEIPAIAMVADEAAAAVDFASIGSNDLCQYLCAADRMNPELADYYQSYHPGLFRMIRNITAAFAKADKPLSICGELGSDPIAIPLLAGLGLRKFSMGFVAVARSKQVLSKFTMTEMRQLAKQALAISGAGKLKTFLEENKRV